MVPPPIPAAQFKVGVQQEGPEDVRHITSSRMPKPKKSDGQEKAVYLSFIM
tara:strand:+ start:430 stop:582 length:153 start_codon:yes stop_codon:yes gene_type:complete